MAKSIVSLLCVCLSLLQAPAKAIKVSEDSTFVFSQELLQLSLKSVYLSDLAYSNDPIAEAGQSYQSILVFNDEPDQAVLVAVDGFCMVAFRGTVITSWADIYQNVRLGNEMVCSSDNVCCNVERGFYEGYNTNYQSALDEAVRTCASACTLSEDGTFQVCPTVVLTGHSQGGSIAAAAALYMADLAPVVITFGQPPTIDAPCELLNSDRYYRFENSRVGRRGTTYDPVPYLPICANQFGMQIMLGEDPTGVAVIGKDTELEFTPYDAADGFASHRLTPDVGYIRRIEALVQANAGATVIRSTGFQDGSVCSENVECDSSRCEGERCVRL